jgi:hypothetical protein
MTREEIEQAIKDAGWEVEGGFLEEMLIGLNNTVSLLASRWAWGADNAVFEVWDEESNLSYWVTEIPTPERAKELIKEHGGPPDEE